MAGESPDRSEQRKSPGESAQGERDPRLAMAGRPRPLEPDQPTAVFKLPALPERESEGKDTADGDGPGASGPRVREAGTETGSVENDRALRSAVAAWVASADDEPESPKSSKSPDSPKSSKDDAQDDSEGAANADDAENAEKSAGSQGAPDAEDSRGAGRAGDDGDPEPDGPKGAADVTAELPEVPAERTALLPAVNAADVADAAETTALPQVRDERADEHEDDADGPDEHQGRDDEPAEGSAEEPVASAKAEKKPEADADTADTADATGDDPEASDKDREPVTDHPTALLTPIRDKAFPGKPSRDQGKGTSEQDTPGKDTSGKEAPGKDSRPAVDQPTTALRKPPAPRTESAPAKVSAAKAGAAGSAGAAAEEKSTERTSTFVPLRTDEDIPRPSWSRNETPAAAGTATAPGKPAADAPGKDRTTDAPGKGRASDGPGGGDGPGSVAASAAPAGPVVPGAAAAEAERTRQQPMPPLDLLAQLTNTPDTPLRTAARRVKIWTPLVIVLLIVLGVAQVVRPLPGTELRLTAESAFTFKGGAIDLGFPKDGQGAVAVDGVGTVATYGTLKPKPIASVTKAMTAYVILQEHPLRGKQKGPKIAIDQRTADEYEERKDSESVEPVPAGMEYTQRQLLELVMVRSANNVARLLARWDAGSEKAFVAKMNAAAEELGMKDTVYTDPSGLNKTTVSTPLDQVKLAEAVMKNEVFREIVNTTQITVPGISGIRYNTADRVLLQDGVGGIKTGSSTPAGGNFLWSANAVVDGRVHRVYGATFGIQKAEKLRDRLIKAMDHSARVIKKAQSSLTSAVVIKKGEVVGRVEDGLGGTTPVVATKDLKAVGWPGHKVEIAIDNGDKAVPGTGKRGDVVGRISVGTGEGRLTAPVALQRDLLEPGLMEKLTRVG
ncbi:serine hydrolase [Streptomyces sp. NPDC000594]|uniref:D-alanyl-D-alanine carboxypeptidase n=1 Tax=Streptomyces sp. NPDC000594 TaxID=3154261 RepID=UPI003334127F